MKNFLLNVLIKIVVLLALVIVGSWVLLCVPALIVSAIVQALLMYYDFNTNEVVLSEFGEKVYRWGLDLLVLPYKLLGVCDDYKGFCQWMGSN